MYAYRIRKYIGAYAAVLNGLDAIVFTGGVGENDAILEKWLHPILNTWVLFWMRKKMNFAYNELHEINTADSKVKILIVPTNEELEIANQCYQLIESP